MGRGGRILLAQTSFLGDVVLTTPLAAAIARGRTESQIWWLVRPDAAALIEPLAPGRVLVFDKRGRDGGLGGLRRLARRLRDLRFDVAIGVQRSLRTAVLLAWAGVPRRIGFADSPGALLYHERVPRRGAHARDRLLALGGPLGVEVDAAPDPALAVDPTAAAAVERRLGAAGALPRDRLLVLAPGSAWATKRWPAGRFAEAAGQLVPARLDRVVVIGGPEDRPLAEEIARELPPGKVLDLSGATDTAEMVAVLARAALVIANDSAPAHVAAALSVPVLAAFGPTVPEQGFAPLGPAARVVGRALECRPCSRHGGRVCPIGTHECLRALTGSEVAGAAEELLARRSEGAARSEAP